MNTGKLWFLALVAAMGGFLFGYDTAVVSGAEQQIQQAFSLSPVMHGWVMSTAAFAPEKIFAFFGIMMILHLLWAIFLVPETKGVQLEDIKDL